MNSLESIRQEGLRIIQEYDNDPNTPEVMKPTPEGASLGLAMLMANDGRDPLPIPLGNVVVLFPREQWPEGLDELVDRAIDGLPLESPAAPAARRPPTAL